MTEVNVGKEDKEFDPSAEMMVNDFDDERTLEEEEAMEATEDTHQELSNLKEEGEMPLEQLMAMYGYAGGGEPPAESSEEEEEEENEGNEEEAENGDNVEEEPSDSDNQGKNYSELQKLYEDEASTTKAGTSKGPNSGDEEDEEDYDYSPEEDEWKKTIMVGSEYQAHIPEGLCKYGDALPYENEDKLLWEPLQMPEEQVLEYLTRAGRPASPLPTPGVPPGSMGPLPVGTHHRDDEHALYLLLQCGYNSDEALRRLAMGTAPQTHAMGLWSEEECRNFENGLRTFGKDFHSIHVKTRSVGELVQFYYLWKKTERHDMFAHKTRLEKKKYALHPGITDYMDRILDEQESSGQTRDRSLSPKSSNCLLMGDPKRKGVENASTAAEGGTSTHAHTLISSLNHRHQEAVDTYLKDKEADSPFASSTNSLTQVQ
ncbi:mesoderm induction early response protein 1-like isoform X2 [Neocloeon triangulifer]|uniref:mesoderm induction early response protein 1-like isoform X2 n=1 Tax=Neocloeon triangulifer TaxID=2078957 RepID=UPI00286F1221|nr:mesoderm induction early response protein 1-like isoform X2 [Neocloeon triangulifer]